MVYPELNQPPHRHQARSLGAESSMASPGEVTEAHLIPAGIQGAHFPPQGGLGANPPQSR